MEGKSGHLMDSKYDRLLADLEIGEDRWDGKIQSFAATDNVQTMDKAFRDDGVIVIRGVVDADTIRTWRHRMCEVDKSLADALRWTGHPTTVPLRPGIPDSRCILFSPHRRDIGPANLEFSSQSRALFECHVARELVTANMQIPCCEPRPPGLLVLDANCKTRGVWHRDATPLFCPRDGSAELADLNLISTPYYYHTQFVPLEEHLSRANGAPEFIVGSHMRNATGLRLNMSRLRGAVLECHAGDTVLVHGNIVHRGAPNPSDDARHMLYTIWTAPWFNEALA